jgi:hypothetical protein
MSDTQQLFALAAVWTVIAFFISRLVANWPGRIALFVALVGIPFWELPFGYYNFRNQCAEKTKLQMLGGISPQKSVCITHFDLSLYRRLIEAGFDRIEVTERADNAREHLGNGKLVLIAREKASSEFCIAFENNIAQSWRILRADTLIIGARDNRRVAQQSYLRWDGMWWQSVAKPVLGVGGVCHGDLAAPITALRRGA